MKLQQRSHATLKSKLQDHKTTEEAIFFIYCGRENEPGSVSSKRLKTKYYMSYLLHCHLFFKWNGSEIGDQPELLMSSLFGGGLCYYLIKYVDKQRDNAANEKEERFILSYLT